MVLITDLQYFATIIEYKNSIKYKYIRYEQYENWQKSSFRNRCIISGANGLVTLSVPVVGGRHSSHSLREIKIDNSKRWQMIHWRTLFSAYNRSPWFEYYKDELLKFYNTKYDSLLKWNLDLLEWTNRKLELNPEIGFTDTWKKNYPPDEFEDWRSRVRPKNYSSFGPYCPVYNQVFEERFGFNANLSIIDLLFCEGPNAIHLLKN